VKGVLTDSFYLPQVLYTYADNFRALKVFIASAYSGVKVELDSKFVFGETNKSEAFRKKFPVGKVHLTCHFRFFDLMKLVD
jgi:hypothetical protein